MKMRLSPQKVELFFFQFLDGVQLSRRIPFQYIPAVLYPLNQSADPDILNVKAVAFVIGFPLLLKVGVKDFDFFNQRITVAEDGC